MSAARDALRSALDPRSVAVIGASDDPNKVGGRPLRHLASHGYRGRVFPINPNRPQVQGLTAYPSFAELPEPPEVAIVALAGEAAVEAVETCAAGGVRVAIVMASGFGEVGPAGKEQEARMRSAARAAGMRVVGPNSMGLANFATGAILSFTTMFLEVAALDGPVAVISQSGGMSVVPYGLLRERGIGVRYSHATGNDCDVTVGELACVVAEDPELRLLLLYLEAIEDAGPLAELGALARERGLRVVALKGGTTPAGQEAARSHTGALATEARVVEAFLERHGIRQAHSTLELVQGAELYLKGWEPAGRRLVMVSNSGASCVLAADAASRLGFPLATLAPGTRARLTEILPAFATVTNPIDVTAALLSNSRLLSDVLPVIATDPAADAVLVSVPVVGEGYDVDAFADDTARFARETGKPVAVTASQPRIAARFAAEELVVFPTEGEAVAALDGYLGHVDRQRGALRAGSHTPPRLPAGPPARLLDEAASLALVACHGVPVVDHRLCASADEAAGAFAGLGGGPVAVKGCSAAVVHKTAAGLVRLDLRDERAVRAAFADVAADRGALVARMARGVRELMIGARVDPVFGPVVVVGDGGADVEAIPDSRVLLWPFDEADVVAALARLRVAPALAGARGRPPADTAAFARAAVAVGALVADPAAGVSALDLNPVLVDEAGCLALDAAVYVAGTSGGTSPEEGRPASTSSTHSTA